MTAKLNKDDTVTIPKHLAMALCGATICESQHALTLEATEALGEVRDYCTNNAAASAFVDEVAFDFEERDNEILLDVIKLMKECVGMPL